MPSDESQTFLEKNFKLNFAIINNLVDLLYKLATNFSNLIMLFSSIRKAVAYLITSSIALFFIKNVKSFFQYFRADNHEDNGFIHSFCNYKKKIRY